MRDIIAILTHLESMVARLESERVSAIERDIALDKLKKLYSDLLEKDALAQPETLLELLFAEDGAPEKAADEVVDVAADEVVDVAPEGAHAPSEEEAEGAPEEEAEGEDVVATAVAVAAAVAAVADVVEDDATDAVAPADIPTVFEPEPAEEESAAEPAPVLEEEGVEPASAEPTPAVEPVEEDRLEDEFAALHGLDHNRILSLYDDSSAPEVEPAPTAEPAPEVKSEPNDVPEVEPATEPEPTELSALEDEPAVELVIDMTEFASPQDGYAAAEEEPTPEPSAEEEPQEESAADEEPAEEPASQDSQIPEVELDIEPFFAPVEPEEEPAAEPEELTPAEPEEGPADAPVTTEEPAAEPAPASAKTSEPEDDFDQPKALADYIGLNDKYIILRDLFGGDHDYYEATIDQLDTFDTLNEALLFLYDNFEWNDKLMGTTVLMEILMRRFQ